MQTTALATQTPLLGASGTSSHFISKRLLDVAASGIALLLINPIFLLVGLCIRIDSKGSIFFSQNRIGLNEKAFKFWKFRSMVTDAEQLQKVMGQQNEINGGVLFKMRDDTRITQVGRFNRRYSIDELPQLWNVFIGDMSLVGPRPALPNEVKQYNEYQKQRLMSVPGITCIWQVSGRSNIPFIEQVEKDLEYI